MNKVQLNILCAVQRLEQIDRECSEEHQHWLWERVMSCDVPRLRALLTPDTLRWEQENKDAFR